MSSFLINDTTTIPTTTTTTTTTNDKDHVAPPQDWKESIPFLTHGHVCDWSTTYHATHRGRGLQGVSCNTHGFVTKLIFCTSSIISLFTTFVCDFILFYFLFFPRLFFFCRVSFHHLLSILFSSRTTTLSILSSVFVMDCVQHVHGLIKRKTNAL